jgi:hypothetical protein
MLDKPFRAERSVRLTHGHSTVTSYAIVRTGEGTICWCDDPVFAYRIVDLLNADEARLSAAPSGAPAKSSGASAS